MATKQGFVLLASGVGAWAASSAIPSPRYQLAAKLGGLALVGIGVAELAGSIKNEGGILGLLGGLFRAEPKPGREITIPAPPSFDPLTAKAPPPSSAAQGIVLGPAAAGVVPVVAQIIKPMRGGIVGRGFLEATVPVDLELTNNTGAPRSATVDVLVTVDEVFGGRSVGATTLGPFDLEAWEVRRVLGQHVSVGNKNTGLFEFGGGTATVQVLVNAQQTQSTWFRVL